MNHESKNMNHELRIKNQEGISSLPLILILGGIIMTSAVGAALLIFLLNNANLGDRQSIDALAAARSGINDAILRIIRDKNCPDASCPAEYDLPLDDFSVEVEICRDTCAGAGKHTVNSVGKSGIYRRKMAAILEVNPRTGEVLIESLKEVPL